MMKKKIIFLSYRRNDSPGYVSKLAKDLGLAFGHNRVFRDIDDIAGGSNWKDILEKNLKNSAVLLLIIGPRWEKIWNNFNNHSGDMVVYELEKARSLKVPIMTITLNNNTLPSFNDLQPISWLYEDQSYDISDHQGRWSTDLEGLIKILESHQSIGHRLTPKKNDSEKKSFGKHFVFLAFMLLTVLFLSSNKSTVDSDDTTPKPILPAKVLISEHKETFTTHLATKLAAPLSPPKLIKQHFVVPNITGTWIANDETIYYVKQSSNATFKINSPDYGTGTGKFFPKMPNKFSVNMQEIGYGEFSVSKGGQRIMGWFMNKDSRQKEYETLTKIK